MEKYIDRNSIVSLETHEMEFIVEFFKVYKKPYKLFGIFKISEGKWVYQTFEEYKPGYAAYDTLEEAFNKTFYGYKQNYLFVDNKAYRKPFATMKDTNKNTYTKYFNDEKEMDKYIESLELDVVKKYVKIKYD